MKQTRQWSWMGDWSGHSYDYSCLVLPKLGHDKETVTEMYNKRMDEMQERNSHKEEWQYGVPGMHSTSTPFVVFATGEPYEPGEAGVRLLQSLSRKYYYIIESGYISDQVTELLEMMIYCQPNMLIEFLDGYDYRIEGDQLLSIFKNSDQIHELIGIMKNEPFFSVYSKIPEMAMRALEWKYDLIKIEEKDLSLYAKCMKLIESFTESNDIDLYSINSGKKSNIYQHSLDLSSRCLTSLQKQSEDKNVYYLNLSFNKFSEIPGNLAELYPNLKVIRLDNNSITAINEDDLKGCENLSSIYLQSNKIDTIASGFFENQQRLETLWLHDNNLSSLPSDSITSRLKAITLKGNNLPKCLDMNLAFTRVSYGNNSIETLISNRYLYDQGIIEDDYVPSYSIRSYNKYLTVISNEEEFELLPHLIDYHTSNYDLEKLVLKGNSVIDIVYPLPGSIELKSIQLDNISNYSDISDKIDVLLSNQRQLTSIRVYNCNLKKIPNSFLLQQNLISLTIGNTQITNVPSEFVEIDTLEVLNLGGNKIEEISNELISKKGLKTLNMLGNNFSEKRRAEIQALIRLTGDDYAKI